ncbi:hypothetical protein PVAND_011899 [Polypedilum vanderplanki]|uniref:Uncharacterized protein n=1 Tax=Polypedilum vanderplanki TaxID=319348 RepID=A0A9J6CK01_POLVA|nr:hypothetical protein PVAND_011899 [Polypedilum vanderplanki]
MEVSVESYKQEKVKNHEISSEDVKLMYEPPRLFRHSLIYRTLRFIYPSNKPKNISHRSFKENLWWFFVMLIGFSLAFSIIDKAWQRFQLNPTFTSVILNDDGMRISYPTVDVCPNISIDSNLVKQILGHKTFNDTTSEIASVIPNFEHLKIGDLKVLGNALKTDDLRILTFKLAVKCNDYIENCKFKEKDIDCCTKFLPILTEHGFCYSFNSKVYGTSLNELSNPEIMTMIEFENHQLTFDLTRASKLFVHSRDEFLNHQTHFVTTIQENKSIGVLFSMRQTHTDENARDLRLYQRKCLFANEKPSKLYSNKRYSNAGCLRDCRIENVQKTCGCLSPFFRPSNLENITYCGIDDLMCLQSEKLIAKNQNCSECLLPCDFDVINIERVSEYLKEDSNVSSVNVDLILWPYIAFHREVRFGFIDFLVAFGSIFALFLGLSFLSVVEILICGLKFLIKKPENTIKEKGTKIVS